MQSAIELSNEIWNLLDINWSSFSLEEQKKMNSQFENKIKLLKEKIKQNDIDVLELVFIKEKNEQLYSMPIDIMFIVYQTLISLDYKTVDNLKEFANYISFYGPDWEEEAIYIIQYLNHGNVSAAKGVALNIDYNKYN